MVSMQVPVLWHVSCLSMESTVQNTGLCFSIPTAQLCHASKVICAAVHHLQRLQSRRNQPNRQSWAFMSSGLFHAAIGMCVS